MTRGRPARSPGARRRRDRGRNAQVRARARWGAKLVVSESGEMTGSASGGCVENEVFGHACEVLEGARPQLLSYGISDDLAFTVGLPAPAAPSGP